MNELAGKLHIAPNQVAMAWLLNQPFPVFPILGTKNPEHLREALAADAVNLTAREVAWLDTGS